MTIRQESKHKFVLYSKKSNKVLGVHPSKERALKQEQAIEISKHKGQKGATKPRPTPPSMEKMKHGKGGPRETPPSMEFKKHGKKE